VTWAHPTADDRFSPVIFGDDVALHDFGKSWQTTGETGFVRSEKTWGIGCVIGTEYLVVERTEDYRGARLVAYAPGEANPRVIAAKFAFFDGHSSVVACGRHGDDLVFLVETSEAGQELFDALITDRKGKLLHRTELGHGQLPDVMEMLIKTDPAHAPFGGELPRYALFPDHAAKTLVMVDLETGAIAWRSKPDDTLRSGVLFHADKRWVWSDRQLAPTIAVFDGETGKLSGAVNVSSDEGILSWEGTTSAIATNDALWLHMGGATTPDDAHIAVLDLATLAPRFVRAIRVTDATAAVRTKLGL